MDTLTVTVTDGVARIVIASDWLWALGALGWLGLYTMWCEGRDLLASVWRGIRAVGSRRPWGSAR